ncbi:MAG: MarR family transcriptional regulator [Planctomycetaceae bacterium]|nr:MarR family transcriptional regulator [Planctomycetaceae bacterium]
MGTSQLERELKKSVPFHSLEQEAVINILRTNDQFQNRFGRLFRQHGLTMSQYNILRILRGAGEPLPSLAIGNRMIQVVPAITGLIDRLEKRELVERSRCTKDRRVVYVSITDAGLEILDKLDEPVSELHKKLAGHLSDEELRQLSRLLEKARQSCLEPDNSHS